ncbi:MAG: TIR domain-containing protein [Sedimentisphaerales bacterium]|nr:TIR domain-containing protein [Sedimentisphaerales bacterium]
MAKNPSVFLSHSSQDKPAVKRLAEDLRAVGIEVWLDEEKIGVGESIAQKLQEGLKQTDYLAIWLTKHATSSGWVETEWHSRLQDEITEGRVIVLPLLAEKCQIPQFLKDKRYADFRENYDAGLADLLRTLNSQREPEPFEFCHAVILAGGLATRLWPLTSDYPKALLYIGGDTLLQHLVSSLNNVPQINEIVVSVDKNKAKYFTETEQQLQKVSNYPVSVVKHASVANKIKGPIAKLGELIQTGRLQSGQRKWTLVIGVDNVFSFLLKDFISFAQNRGVSSNAVIEMKVSPKEFGVAKTSSDILKSVIEKPQGEEKVTTKISTACYIFTVEDTNQISTYLKDPCNDDSLGSFMAWLCAQSKVLACCLNSEWVDVGTREGLLSGNRMLISRVGRKPSLIPGKYRIIEPVYIEDGVHIVDSIVGPNVFLGKGCYINNSVVSNAIIYEKCFINSSRPFEHIVAGPHSRFEGNIGAAVYGPKTKITTL